MLTRLAACLTTHGHTAPAPGEFNATRDTNVEVYINTTLPAQLRAENNAT